jgi:hypothetical protein
MLWLVRPLQRLHAEEERRGSSLPRVVRAVLAHLDRWAAEQVQGEEGQGDCSPGRCEYPEGTVDGE